MSFRISSNKVLDREECYNLWIHDRISVYRIPKILADKGIVNPKTGKPVTHQAVWRSANLHILDFPEVAKNDTVSLFAQHGKILEDEEWGREMINRARYFLGKRQYSQWLSKNEEYRKYA
jgi:hypothetical protein